MPPVTEAAYRDNAMRQVLGGKVFDVQGVEVGAVYDVYADSQTGQIEYVSVDTLEGETPVQLFQPNLVPVSRAAVQAFGVDGSVRLGIDRQALYENPYKTSYGERLSQMLSVRSVPGSAVLDEDGIEIGNVITVNYKDGVLNNLYFKGKAAGENISGQTAPLFKIPYQALSFDARVEEGANGKAIFMMTQSQAELIQAVVREEQAQAME